MKTVALIEFNNWHSECLYSQLLYLKSKGYRVHLICNERLKNSIENPELADTVLFEPMHIFSLLRVWYYILKNKIKTIIVNTAQGSKMLKFSMLPFPSDVKFYGLIHNLQKLNTSSGQKRIMKRVKNYFVLGDFLADNFPAIPGLRCQATFPICLPDYSEVEVEKNPNEIWIMIGGALDYRRRDYKALFQRGTKYDKRIKFVLLGNASAYDGPEISRLINENGLEKSFILFDKFVPNDMYYAYARKCDYIMVGVHEGTPGFQNYLKYKITGTLLTAYALRKPMLCDRAFADLPDFAPYSIFYDRADLAITVNALDRPLKGHYYGESFEKRFAVERQADLYTQFLH